jgi:hypothetical protein
LAPDTIVVFFGDRGRWTGQIMWVLGMLSWKSSRHAKWDGVKEECPGDAAANQRLRREYPAPWKYSEV